VAAEVTVSVRRILLLAVLVAALGTYLYVYEIPKAEREGKKEKLVAVDKDAITGITLAFPDHEIELQKKDGGWRMVKPIDAAADESAVTGLLTTLTGAEIQKTLDGAPEDLAAYGLDAPKPRLQVTVAEGAAPPAIAVGKNTAIGGRAYVRRDDEPKILLVASTVPVGLNKQAKDLRDKQMLAFQDDDVTRVEIAPAGEPAIALVRKSDTDWAIEPGDNRADPTEVRSYLAGLRATRAVDFVDDAATDLGKYGLAEPRLKVTVTTKKPGARPATLLLGGERTEGTQKQTYAMREGTPTVVALGDWSFRSLSKSVAQLRDKTVLGFDPDRVGEVAIERKDGSAVNLARTEKGWSVAGAEGAKPKDAAISRFLDDLRDLRGSDVAAEPSAGKEEQYGLDIPDFRITLTDRDDHVIGTVLASKHDGKYYVMRADGSTIFGTRDYMYTRLDKQRADFLESTPAAGAPPDGGAAGE
jgi:Domain of unknown function (DUF4340)